MAAETSSSPTKFDDEYGVLGEDQHDWVEVFISDEVKSQQHSTRDSASSWDDCQITSSQEEEDVMISSYYKLWGGCCSPNCTACTDMHLEENKEYIQWKQFGDDPITIKERRGAKYYREGAWFGKRRRYGLHHSLPHYRTEVVRIEDDEDIFLPRYQQKRHRHNSRSRNNYTMTAFDFFVQGSSSSPIRRSEDSWEQVRQILSKNALYLGKQPRQTMRNDDSRKIEIYDLPILGILIDIPHQQLPIEETTEDWNNDLQGLFAQSNINTMKMKENNHNNKIAWRMFYSRDPCYYEFRTGDKRKNEFKAEQAIEIAMEVKAVKMPGLVHLLQEDREVLVHFQARFVSRQTSAEQNTNLQVPLINPASMVYEIRQATRKTLRSSTVAAVPPKFDMNYRHCWASTPSDHPDYEDWYMEIDLGKVLRRITSAVVGLIIQGRSPVLESFPHVGTFANMEEWNHYNGPIYPVLNRSANDAEEGQWVENFEVLARYTNGLWFSLGLYKGNHNCLHPIRIDLSVISEQPDVRFLRIRPLAQSKGGFHGKAPAFKLAVIGRKQPQQQRGKAVSSSDLAPVVFKASKEIPKGFVRYNLKIANEVPIASTDTDLDYGKRCRFPKYVHEMTSMHCRKGRISKKEFEKSRKQIPTKQMILEMLDV